MVAEVGPWGCCGAAVAIRWFCRPIVLPAIASENNQGATLSGRYFGPAEIHSVTDGDLFFGDSWVRDPYSYE